MDGAPIDPHRVRDLTLALAGRVTAPHFCPARYATGATLPFFLLSPRQRGSRLGRWAWSRGFSVRPVVQALHIHMTTPSSEQLIQGGRHIKVEVEAVGHLDGIRRTTPTRLGVGFGPIAAEDLDAGMIAQPDR